MIIERKMTHGSLFSGIGGFDLAAKWIGWSNIFQCEIDPFCQNVLKYHFPECELFTDIKTSDFKKYANTIDVISGGFPCQPFSVAGKRKGTKDDRFLWDEMLRVVRDVKPSWVVAENVPGLLTQERGLVFERVCVDLENSGYQVQPFVIPACSVGAPHKRDRLFIIANSSNSRIKGLKQQMENGIYGLKTTTDSKSAGQQTWNERQGKIKFGRKNKRDEFSNHWENFPTQSPVCGGNDGLSGKLDGITFPKWRRESIKSYGNAVVPQVVFEIFKAIDIYENSLQNV